MDYSNAIERIDLANARIVRTKLEASSPMPGPPDETMVLAKKTHWPRAGNVYHYLSKKTKSYPKSKFSK
jgi:hypothetical protein